VGPPEEPGVSIEAMEVGVQFLRDATEQYNFESELRPVGADDPSAAAEAQLISDATLEAANQGDVPVPVSAALTEDLDEVLAEPGAREIDLRSNAIVAASLFDQPGPAADDPELAEELEEEQAEDDFAVAMAAPMHQPQVISDDPSDVDDARQQEIQRLLDERVKRRLRVQRLPKELGSSSGDNDADTAPNAASDAASDADTASDPDLHRSGT